MRQTRKYLPAYIHHKKSLGAAWKNKIQAAPKLNTVLKLFKIKLKTL